MAAVGQPWPPWLIKARNCIQQKTLSPGPIPPSLLPPPPCIVPPNAFRVHSGIVRLDSLLKTVHWWHASESVRRRWEKSCSLQVISCFPFLNFVGEKVYQEKQSYKDMPRVLDSSGTVSALLATLCVPSSIRRGLGRRLVWVSFWRGAHVPTPGYCSWSVLARGGSTPLLLALWGSLGELNHQQWSACSLVLACPCWSLECLLFTPQKNCLRKI